MGLFRWLFGKRQKTGPAPPAASEFYVTMNVPPVDAGGPPVVIASTAGPSADPNPLAATSTPLSGLPGSAAGQRADTAYSPSARDHYEQGLAAEQQADHDRAIAHLNEAIRLDPADADAYYVRGLVLEILGEYGQALADLEALRRLTPTSLDAIGIQGIATGRLARVVRTGPRIAHGVERVLQRGTAKDMARIRFKRGLACQARGEFAPAIADFSEALHLHPEDRAYYERGRAYAACARFEEAIADLTKVIPFNPPVVQLLLGSCYKETGDPDRAAAALTAAARLDRTDPDIYLARGTAYHLKGEQDRAIADYTEAVRLDPELVPAYEGRAAAYRKRGDEDQARADEHRARQLLKGENRTPAGLPSARRVAARALVLAAVFYRAQLESDRFAEAWRSKLLAWIDALDLGPELERGERSFLHTPVGHADAQLVANASWRVEGLGVLAWALGRFDLPAYDDLGEFATPPDVGFTEKLLSAMDTAAARELLQSAGLRPKSEIDRFSRHITLVSWRLRQFLVDPDRPVPSMDFEMRGGRRVAVEDRAALRRPAGPGIGEGMDFAGYLRGHGHFEEHWLDGLRLIDGDLALGDTSIAAASPEDVRRCASIAVERQIAAYWLRGDDRTYSKVIPSTLLSAC
jgi:tetratricopeptide (TPR) repeat protein